MSYISKVFYRFLVTILVTLVVLIVLKKSSRFKSFFHDYVMGVNFNFASVNRLYHDFLGTDLPFDFRKTDLVFSEKLNYKSIEPYLDGAILVVDNNYLVPAMDDGLVVFSGFKDDYGNTVIIQQANGVDVWYSNLVNIDVKLYEYISRGKLLGECSNSLYLVFKKDGNVLDYKDFFKD